MTCLTSEAVDEARLRAREVDERVLSCPPSLPSTPDGLYDSIRKALGKACDEGTIGNKPQDVYKLLVPERRLLPRQGVVQIGGGDIGRFVRSSDGATFDFGITADYPATGSPRLVAFRYRLVFQDRSSPAFLRFDLNRKPHEDPLREPQCHIHPGHQDIRCPFPLLSPLEMLGYLIHGCRVP